MDVSGIVSKKKKKKAKREEERRRGPKGPMEVLGDKLTQPREDRWPIHSPMGFFFFFILHFHREPRSGKIIKISS